MCGICGIYNFKNKAIAEVATVRKMNQALHHRGPDDEGYHFSDNLGLGMKRLSIIDLSGGHQPIYNEDKSVCLVYNGEVYNFKELRQELEKKGHRFYTNTDTEAIVHLYEEKKESFVKYLEGMFGLALWDEKEKKLILARDHFGIKPLYYAFTTEGVIFSSEIRSILSSNLISKGVDYKVFDEYFSLYYTTAPGTMFQEIKKLLPAHYLICKPDECRMEKYWQLEYKTADRLKPKEYEEGILQLLKESVKKHLIADVPLGIFLSGGLDSTAILATMYEEVREPIKSFSINFADKAFDETSEIKKVVQWYKTDHHEIRADPEVIPKYLPLAIEHLGEPTGDWPCALEYFLSEFSRPKVKVVLSGTGGDEIFAGYPTLTAYRLSRIYEKVPKIIRKNIIAPMVNYLPVSMTNLSFDYKAKLFVRGCDYDPLQAHFSWKEIYTSEEKERLYNNKIKEQIKEPNGISVFAYYLKDLPQEQDWISKLLYIDMKIFLSGCCVPPLDTSLMANSQEGRIPFLNHKLVEYAATIPPDLKHRGFTTKYIFRQAVKNILPPEIVNKKKMGFSLPMSSWIRNELSGFIDECLVNNTAVSKYFDKNYVHKLVKEHRANQKDNGRKIACLVSFMIWEKQYQDYLG